jgi:hypothetical protein
MKQPGWTEQEIECAVSAYADMLLAQFYGERFIKAEMVRRCQAAELRERSRPSIEYRWCNISAVLKESGCSWVRGYVPFGNVGTKMKELVRKHLELNGVTARACDLIA